MKNLPIPRPVKQRQLETRKPPDRAPQGSRACVEEPCEKGERRLVGFVLVFFLSLVLHMVSPCFGIQRGKSVAYGIGCLLLLVPLLVSGSLGLVGLALLVVEGLPLLAEHLANVT